jgi:hypothetical protein
MDWPGQLDAAPEIDIETRAGDDAPVHCTTIWVVVDGEDVFVRSYRGESGRWYREISGHPDAVVHIDGESQPVRAIPASDPESAGRASDAYRNKYADSSVVDSMLTDEVTPTTLRLEPR